MKKREWIESYIRVTAKEPYFSRRDQADERAILQAMVDQICRHVDGVGSAEIEDVYLMVCEFCGADWTAEPDSDGLEENGCCVEAVEEFNKLLKSK